MRSITGSPVSYAVLGLVIEQPSYGYELLRRLRERYGELLEVSSPSQVYAALDRLQREGLIVHAPDAGERDDDGPQRQPKVIYRATGDGARAHRRWLAERLWDDEQRVELVGRLITAGTQGPDALAALIDRCERDCTEAARLVSQPDPREDASGGESERSFVERLVNAERRFALEARRRWIDFAREELRARGTRRDAGARRGSGA